MDKFTSLILHYQSILNNLNIKKDNFEQDITKLVKENKSLEYKKDNTKKYIEILEDRKYVLLHINNLKKETNKELKVALKNNSFIFYILSLLIAGLIILGTASAPLVSILIYILIFLAPAMFIKVNGLSLEKSLSNYFKEKNRLKNIKNMYSLQEIIRDLNREYQTMEDISIKQEKNGQNINKYTQELKIIQENIKELNELINILRQVKEEALSKVESLINKEFDNRDIQLLIRKIEKR